MTGIYKIQSIKYPNRIYIGSAVDFKKRVLRHKWELKNNRHCNSKLQRHFNKYGENDIEFIFIIGCEKSELIDTEQFYIDSHKTYFNICNKAGSLIGFKQSKEQIEKTRNKNKGQKRSDEAKLKMRLAKLGKPNLFCKGKSRSKETIEKLRIASTGKPAWNKGKKSIFKGMKNRYSQETLDKMRESALKRCKV